MELAGRKSIGWGIVGALLLMSFYWLVLSLANSFDHAVEQWQQWWYWIVLLVIGFGSQVGLYSYVRYTVREKRIKSVGGEVAATGGVSAGSMVACCAHHVVDVLPIIGLSAVAVFLVEYQLFFMLAGVVSNVIGILYMLEIIKKHSLYNENSGLGRLVQFNLASGKRWAITGSVLVLVAVLLWIPNRVNREVAAQKAVPNGNKVVANEKPSTVKVFLATRTDVGGGLTIDVTPLSFESGETTRFEIGLSTHQGDLNFDLIKQSLLMDDRGGEYRAAEWKGESGGHHLTGELVFSSLDKGVKDVRLVISDVYGVEERTFEWEVESL